MSDEADRRIVRAALRRLEAERTNALPVRTDAARRAVLRESEIARTIAILACAGLVWMGASWPSLLAWGALHFGVFAWMVWRDNRRGGAFWP